jgi:hypothetical protein
MGQKLLMKREACCTDLFEQSVFDSSPSHHQGQIDVQFRQPESRIGATGRKSGDHGIMCYDNGHKLRQRANAVPEMDSDNNTEPLFVLQLLVREPSHSNPHLAPRRNSLICVCTQGLGVESHALHFREDTSERGGPVVASFRP